jgi:hypothetical protein
MEGAKAGMRHPGRCSLHQRGSPSSSSAPSSACSSRASSPSAREPPLEMLMQERLDGGSGEGIQSQDPLLLGLHHRRRQERRAAMSRQCLAARWARSCPTVSARSGCWSWHLSLYCVVPLYPRRVTAKRSHTCRHLICGHPLL